MAALPPHRERRARPCLGATPYGPFWGPTFGWRNKAQCSFAVLLLSCLGALQQGCSVCAVCSVALLLYKSAALHRRRSAALLRSHESETSGVGAPPPPPHPTHTHTHCTPCAASTGCSQRALPPIALPSPNTPTNPPTHPQLPTRCSVRMPGAVGTGCSVRAPCPLGTRCSVTVSGAYDIRCDVRSPCAFGTGCSVRVP